MNLIIKKIWPIQRKFVRLNKRCSRCILTDSFSPVKDGLCELCREYKSNPKQIKNVNFADGLDYLMADVITSNKYDILVLMSGGKDSAYLLDQLRRCYPKVRPLCLIVNNGFMSPFAIDNARYVCEKFNVDLLISNDYIQCFKNIFRDTFLDLNGRGCYGVIDYIDGSTIFTIGEIIAKEFGIKYMFSGLTWIQLEKILNIHTFHITQNDITQVFPLAAWRPSETLIKDYIKEHRLLLPGTEDPLVSNSQLILPMAVIDILNNGYSSFEPEFAQLIREGKASRLDWLYTFEFLEYATRKGFLHKDVNKVLKKLNLTLEDITNEMLHNGCNGVCGKKSC